jgi:hypothetical protein
MKSQTKFTGANGDLRQKEADKTSRLRALRLAKESEAAARIAADSPPKTPRRPSREASRPDQKK